MAPRSRVVVDANVFISAFLFKGAPGLVLDLLDAGVAALVYSRQLREETERILSEKFGWSRKQIDNAAAEYWSEGILVTPLSAIRACSDPGDDYLLECAVEGEAQFLVTGDKDLLRMKRFRDCEIVTPVFFLSRFTK